MARQIIGRVQPSAPAAWDAAAAYGKLERVLLKGTTYECVADCAAGEGPETKPENWLVISSGITAAQMEEIKAQADKGVADAAAARAAADAARSTADAALPKSGGALGGMLDIHKNQNAIRFFNANKVQGEQDHEQEFTILGFYDKNSSTLGDILCNSLRWPNGSVEQQMYLRAYEDAAGGKARALVGAFVTDGRPRGVSPAPREGFYDNDIDTLWASVNRHPQKLTAARTFHVGGANASDTAGLFKGRGESAEMPFATISAAITFVCTHYSSSNYNVHLVLHQDFEEDVYIYDTPVREIVIKSDSAKRTITGTIETAGGVLKLQDIKINAPADAWNLISLDGRARRPKVYIDAGVELSGSVKGAVIASSYDASVVIFESPTGTIAGKRYSCTNGGRILTGGRGPSAIPGTEAGTCDASSVYA